MDRLVCGDVGFGKTEVAMRAAFKAVQDGKQVAVLVPTTLLASQHMQTFSERFANYPVRVEMLSRFLTPAEAQSGHRRPGHRLGRHRHRDPQIAGSGRQVQGPRAAGRRRGTAFWRQPQGNHQEVEHGRGRADLDRFAHTANARNELDRCAGICRSLPRRPSARRPILTYVGEYDERAVAEAIRRELLREGQVFFVHHRVRDIEKVAARLRELVPEARVAIANGQMDEGSLERVVLDFWEGRYDVLVCTTIIESGIDMPTVNTLVIDRADMLGLGQLHQLRGRVGRAGQRAYAYLFYPQNHKLTEEAYERLRTIGEHTELGSGFKIAMRDLEIRGAGNLLGADQSGHIAAVGYDLYVQMVSEAVADMKGEPVRATGRDPPRPAHDGQPSRQLRGARGPQAGGVPEAWPPSPRHEEVDDVESEWTDRYGPLPKAAIGVARHRPSESRVRPAGDPRGNGRERGDRYPFGQPRGPGLARFPESERAGAPRPGVAACGLQGGPGPAGRARPEGRGPGLGPGGILRGAGAAGRRALAVSQAGAAGD